MRCTKCSHPVRPVVALDIDGTIGDHHTHFYNFACQYFQEELRPDFDGSCEWHEWWSMDLDLYREAKLAYRQGGGKRSMPPFPHLLELIGAIKGWGAELWITTTRPYLRLDNIDPDTRFWLGRFGIPVDGMIYDEFKYRMFAEIMDSERVVAIVEDLPNQWDQAEYYFPGKPIMHYATHNQVGRKEPGHASLAVIAELVAIRLQAWNKEHNKEPK